MLGPEAARGGLRRPGRAPARRRTPARTSTRGSQALLDAERARFLDRARRASAIATRRRRAAARRVARAVDDLRFAASGADGARPRARAHRARQRGRRMSVAAGGRQAAGRPQVRPRRPDRRARPGGRGAPAGGSTTTLVDEAGDGRRPGRRPAAALRRPHRRRARRGHRLRQVLDVQRADRSRPGRGRRTPPDDVVGHAPASGAPRAPTTCSSGSASRRGTRSRATRMLDSRPPTTRDLDGPGAARPARPRLDRGLPPPRGRPAGRAGRPAGLGARPAEVRRRGDPRPLPQAARLAPATSCSWCSTTSTRCRRTAARRCSSDVERLLAADGLDGVPVIATSARARRRHRRAQARRSPSGWATRRRSRRG